MIPAWKVISRNPLFVEVLLDPNFNLCARLQEQPFNGKKLKIEIRALGFLSFMDAGCNSVETFVNWVHKEMGCTGHDALESVAECYRLGILK
jgi:hypothetical protein